MFKADNLRTPLIGLKASVDRPTTTVGGKLSIRRRARDVWLSIVIFERGMMKQSQART